MSLRKRRRLKIYVYNILKLKFIYIFSFRINQIERFIEETNNRFALENAHFLYHRNKCLKRILRKSRGLTSLIVLINHGRATLPLMHNLTLSSRHPPLPRIETQRIEFFTNDDTYRQKPGDAIQGLLRSPAHHSIPVCAQACDLSREKSSEPPLPYPLKTPKETSDCAFPPPPFLSPRQTKRQRTRLPITEGFIKGHSCCCPSVWHRKNKEK